MGRNVEPISHLFYADDMLIFTNGRLRSLQRLKNLMGKYEEAAGQKINLSKSAFYVSKRITRGRLSCIQRLTGCMVKRLPFKYLGAPVHKGHCRIEYFSEIVDRFTARVEGWYSRFLSFGGKVTLIKSVIASLPLHVLSCMVVPRQILKRIESLMSTFL